MKSKSSIEEMVEKFEEVFLEDKATEIVKARLAIVQVLKKQRVSLPGAVFALDLVKAELIRGQLLDFLGSAKLTDELPLKLEAEPE